MDNFNIGKDIITPFGKGFIVDIKQDKIFIKHTDGRFINLTRGYSKMNCLTPYLKDIEAKEKRDQKLLFKELEVKEKIEKKLKQSEHKKLYGDLKEFNKLNKLYKSKKSIKTGLPVFESLRVLKQRLVINHINK